MTERLENEGSASFTDQPIFNDGMTAGALLRRSREAAGMHIAALAVALKVPVRKLEALEEDRLDLLPDAVFMRALASSVCRALKTDPQPVLARLPQTAVPRLVQDGEGINAPFRAPGDGAPPSWIDQLSRPVFLVVFALLLGALVLIFLPSAQREDKVVAASSPATTTLLAAEPAVSRAADTVQSVPAASVEPQALPLENAVAQVVATNTPAMVPALVEVASAPVSDSPAAAVSPNGILVLRTRGPSWIEVTDATGVVAMRKLLATGELAAPSGALPLQVTVGSADATEVQVRGKPFDLRPVSRDNVAHFEVK